MMDLKGSVVANVNESKSLLADYRNLTIRLANHINGEIRKKELDDGLRLKLNQAFNEILDVTREIQDFENVVENGDEEIISNAEVEHGELIDKGKSNSFLSENIPVTEVQTSGFDELRKDILKLNAKTKPGEPLKELCCLGDEALKNKNDAIQTEWAGTVIQSFERIKFEEEYKIHLENCRFCFKLVKMHMREVQRNAGESITVLPDENNLEEMQHLNINLDETNVLKPQANRRCYTCKEKGHVKRDCPFKGSHIRPPYRNYRHRNQQSHYYAEVNIVTGAAYQKHDENVNYEHENCDDYKLETVDFPVDFAEYLASNEKLVEISSTTEGDMFGEKLISEIIRDEVNLVDPCIPEKESEFHEDTVPRKIEIYFEQKMDKSNWKSNWYTCLSLGMFLLILLHLLLENGRLESYSNWNSGVEKSFFHEFGFSKPSEKLVFAENYSEVDQNYFELPEMILPGKDSFRNYANTTVSASKSTFKSIGFTQFQKLLICIYVISTLLFKIFAPYTLQKNFGMINMVLKWIYPKRKWKKPIITQSPKIQAETNSKTFCIKVKRNCSNGANAELKMFSGSESRSKITVFDGSPTVSFSAWIKKLKLVLLAEPLPPNEDQKLAILLLHLDGKAEIAYKSMNDDDKKHFDKVVKHLEKIFPADGVKKHAEGQLLKCFQKDDENVHQFSNRLSKIIDLMLHGESNEFIHKYLLREFLARLKPELGLKVRTAEPDDYETAIKVATKIEDYQLAKIQFKKLKIDESGAIGTALNFETADKPNQYYSNPALQQSSSFRQPIQQRRKPMKVSFADTNFAQPFGISYAYNYEFDEDAGHARVAADFNHFGVEMFSTRHYPRDSDSDKINTESDNPSQCDEELQNIESGGTGKTSTTSQQQFPRGHGKVLAREGNSV